MTLFSTFFRHLAALVGGGFALVAILFLPTSASAQSDTTRLYQFAIHEDIMPSTANLVRNRLADAEAMDADAILIDMKTYGGLLDAADSIRTMLLNCPRPVWVYVANQAASAGALIAVAADSIYMQPGSSIGAASVVDQNGNLMPDKYQSFMRGMIRSTAEAHGKLPVVQAGDTTWVWHRDPAIAESMVGTYSDTGDSLRVVTFTPEEAVEAGYCEGIFPTIESLHKATLSEPYDVVVYEPTLLDKWLGFLTNPAVQGVFIMLIIGGIYFEMQSPGLGLPSVVAIAGAALYFAPLYIGGLLEYWELAIFLVGIVLIFVEIFVTPGFGVAGILGILGIVVGLTFSAIESDLLRYIPTGEISIGYIVAPLCTTIVAVALATLFCIFFGGRWLKGSSPLRNKVVLSAEMVTDGGFASHEQSLNALVGARGTTTTTLRPAGRVLIDGKSYAATTEHGQFIANGKEIKVVRVETGTLYVTDF